MFTGMLHVYRYVTCLQACCMFTGMLHVFIIYFLIIVPSPAIKSTRAMVFHESGGPWLVRQIFDSSDLDSSIFYCSTPNLTSTSLLHKNGTFLPTPRKILFAVASPFLCCQTLDSDPFIICTFHYIATPLKTAPVLLTLLL